MKILLAAVNAKYIHSNLGIYSLKSYGDRALGLEEAIPGTAGSVLGTGIVSEGDGGSCQMRPRAVIELAEYTINHQLDYILQDIYRRKPDVIGFSCYIWNIEYVKALGADLKKVLPGVSMWLGGPEVSYDAEKVLKENIWADGVMKGEGEETFAQLAAFFVDKERENPEYAQRLEHIPGLTFRCSDGTLADTGLRPVMDLSRVPFPYGHIRLKDLEHRIIYYESSRGCPFSCSYCLSSIDKSVRLRNLDLVREELAYFIEAGVPQVKFVDRTFNCNKRHAMAIWQFIYEHDNGVTNFHFEIAADLLDGEEMELLRRMRPGLVQLEIGVQSTNQDTLRAIRRRTDIEKIRRVTREINAGKNVHQHLDLIAGLPQEDMASFRNSFNQVYAMEPEQLQLGFLKVLKGSYMEEMARAYDLAYSARPPYEVLSTRWLSYGDILELKGVEEMVEVYYNSRQFTYTLADLGMEYSSPYNMFLDMASYYRDNGLMGVSHNRIARYEILYRIITQRLGAAPPADSMPDRCPPAGPIPVEPLSHVPASIEKYRDLLIYDLYLRENVKSRPSFARDQSPYKTAVREFFRREEDQPGYLKDYHGYDYRQMSKMAHVEVMGDGRMVLFDYKRRDPLTYNAWACAVGRI